MIDSQLFQLQESDVTYLLTMKIIAHIDFKQTSLTENSNTNTSRLYSFTFVKTGKIKATSPKFKTLQEHHLVQIGHINYGS